MDKLNILIATLTNERARLVTLLEPYSGLDGYGRRAHQNTINELNAQITAIDKVLEVPKVFEIIRNAIAPALPVAAPALGEVLTLLLTQVGEICKNTDFAQAQPVLDSIAEGTMRLYTAYNKAGFSPDQAMQLTIAMVSRVHK